MIPRYDDKTKTTAGRGGEETTAIVTPAPAPGTLLATAATTATTAAIAITGEGRAVTDRGPVAPASDDLKILRDDYDDVNGGGGGCGIRSPPTKGGGSRSRCTK
jgi:hypothetical protein